jgi:hypothetical protein
MEEGHRWLSIIRTVILLIPLFGCIFLCFGFFSFPPTEWITHNFFEAVIAYQMWRAVAFSYNQNHPGCVYSTETAARGYMAQYSGAEVRNVSITVFGSGGSDESIQSGHVTFEYHMPREAIWNQGNMHVVTSYDDFSFRYVCGNAP